MAGSAWSDGSARNRRGCSTTACATSSAAISSRRAMSLTAPTASSASRACGSMRRNCGSPTAAAATRPTAGSTCARTGVSRQYGPVGVQVAGTVSQPARDRHRGAARASASASPGCAPRSAAPATPIACSRAGGSDYGAFTADVAGPDRGGPLTIDIRRATLGRDQRAAAGAADAGGTVRRAARCAAGQGLGGIVRLAAAGRYQQAIVNLRARNAVLPAPAEHRGRRGDRRCARDPLRPARDRRRRRSSRKPASASPTSLRFAPSSIIAAGGVRPAVLAEGTSGVPFRIAINSELQPELWRAALKGRVNGIDVRTDSPARIVPRGGYLTSRASRC